MADISSSKSNASLPSPGGVIASLQTEIRNMEVRFEALRQAQASARRQTIVATLVILVLFLIFFFVTWMKVSKNFSQDQVQKAMIGPAYAVREAATKRMLGVVQTVAPEYQKLFIERARIAGPEIATHAVEEFKKLPDEMGKMILQQLGQSFSKVAKRAEGDLKTTFPELAGDGAKEHLEKLAAKLADQSEPMKKFVADRTNQELAKLQDILVKLPSPPEAQGPNPDAWKLQQMFAHSLLMMLDHEIMTLGEHEDAKPTPGSVPGSVPGTATPAK